MSSYKKPPNEPLTNEEVRILELVGSPGWSELFKHQDEVVRSSQLFLLSNKDSTIEEVRYHQGILRGCSIISTVINTLEEKFSIYESMKEDDEDDV